MLERATENQKSGGEEKMLCALGTGKLDGDPE